MRTNIHSSGIELTPSISDYITKKMPIVSELIDPNDESAICNVTVEKTTTHHRGGDVYRANYNMHVSGKNFMSSAKRDNLYAAIDEGRAELVKALKSHKGKRATSIRHGGAKLKRMLKMLSW